MTAKRDAHPSGAATARSRRFAMIFAGIATVAAYMGWLAWDRTDFVGDDGRLHGPYETWQVIGLALTLALVAAVVGWRQWPWSAAVTITVVLTVSWSLNAVTDPGDGASLWPVGAAMLATGTFAGTIVAAVAAEAVSMRRRNTPRPTRPLT